jgi:hypothetical protein
MNYQYSPIYKYIFLIILITSFLNYYTSIIKSDFLLLGVLFTSLFLLSDFILIENHPNLLDDTNQLNVNVNQKIPKKKEKSIINEIELLETFTDDLTTETPLSELTNHSDLEINTESSNLE